MKKKNPFDKHFTLYQDSTTVDPDIHMLDYKGPPPENLKEAFLISIAKWKFLSSFSGQGTIDDRGCYTCGLCMFFDLLCVKCPIFKQTEQEGCENTPYYKYSMAQTLAKQRRFAKQELNFLLKLYEKYKKEKKS